jgi:hypothetical protein
MLAPHRSRDGRPPPKGDDVPERALRRLGVTGVALALAGAVSFQLFDHDVVGTSHLLASAFGSQKVGSDAIALLGLLPFIALAGQRRHYRRSLLFVAASGGLLALLAHGLRFSPTGSSSHGVWTYALGCSVLAAALIAATVEALARWLASVAPEAAATSRVLIRRSWRYAIIVVITLGAMLQLAAPSTLHHRTDGSAGALLNTLADVPTLLVNFAPIPLATILGVGLALSLGRGAVAGAEPDFSAPATRITLALLFSVIVVRRGGAIHGYPAPLAFGIALLALTSVLRPLVERRRARLIRDPAARATAPDLLSRWERLALLTRRRNTLADDLVTGRIDESAYDANRTSLETRMRSLANAPVLLAHNVSVRAREGDLRALGLAAGQPVGVRVRAVIRSGWWLVALPIVYSWAVTIQHSGATALSSQQQMGGLFLAENLIDQAVMWPIAVWCFVALFPIVPGQNGPVKGLVAATAFAIPSALAASLIDQPLTPSGGWWFVSAELALLFGGVGILLDHNALRRANMPLRQLGEIYQITSVRSALAYLSPLAALLFAVVQQLTSGDASSSVQELVNNASAILPRGGH